MWNKGTRAYRFGVEQEAHPLTPILHVKGQGSVLTVPVIVPTLPNGSRTLIRT